MKNYFLLLKETLQKKKKVNISEDEEIKFNCENKVDNQVIANTLGLEYSIHSLRILPSEYSNRFRVDSDNMIFLYPPNGGMPTCPFEFYKGGKLIISNREAYSEITNLDEIILQIVRIIDKCLDDGIVINPYYFMLKLDGEVKENYRGSATLVITEKTIIKKSDVQNFDMVTKDFINHFLDHFIGWNFGVSVNRNETLRNELQTLNEKVIDKGIRKYAGPGFKVYGVVDEVYHGLQHYYLPIEKSAVKKKIKN